MQGQFFLKEMVLCLTIDLIVLEMKLTVNTEYITHYPVNIDKSRLCAEFIKP